MVILGIDPGSSRVGYGLIKKDQGELKLLSSGLLSIKSTDKNRRLLDLEKSFNQLLKKTKPDLAVVEKLFFVKNVKTGIEVSQSRGVLTLLLIKHKIPILEFTPLQIKQIVTGYGKSDKQAMTSAAQRILKAKKIQGGDDAADAIAAAISGANYPLALKFKPV